MSFSEAANMALANIYARMGSPAVFAPAAGDPVACTIIVDHSSDWQPGGAVQVAEPQIVISYRRSEIDRKVRRGETFTVDGTVYTVRSMENYPGSWTEFEGKAAVEE